MKFMARKYKTTELSLSRDMEDEVPRIVEDNAFPVMYSTSQEAYDDDYFFIELFVVVPDY